MEPQNYLIKLYTESEVLVLRQNLPVLEDELTIDLNLIIENSESSKAVLSVFLTSCIYKIINPGQDIRKHQTSIPGGYSGRTFDTKYITPFLKQHKFPAMAESGWLTRSLEQKVPYDFDYSGAIRPDAMKKAFLQSIDYIERNPDSVPEIVKFIFFKLIEKRNSQDIVLSKPHNLTIDKALGLIHQHINSPYAFEGASRLPTLALYAVYKCLVEQLERYRLKNLLPIESHTSADARSGRIGDIDIVDLEGKVFEAIEVKHNIPITLQIVKDGYEKFKATQINRYYILSTADIDIRDHEQIEREKEKIRLSHGCSIVVNGVFQSLKYYLRLLENPDVFISEYVDLVRNDPALKFEHKRRWNEITSS